MAIYIYMRHNKRYNVAAKFLFYFLLFDNEDTKVLVLLSYAHLELSKIRLQFVKALCINVRACVYVCVCDVPAHTNKDTSSKYVQSTQCDTNVKSCVRLFYTICMFLK